MFLYIIYYIYLLYLYYIYYIHVYTCDHVAWLFCFLYFMIHRFYSFFHFQFKLIHVFPVLWYITFISLFISSFISFESVMTSCVLKGDRWSLDHAVDAGTGTPWSMGRYAFFGQSIKSPASPNLVSCQNCFKFSICLYFLIIWFICVSKWVNLIYHYIIYIWYVDIVDAVLMVLMFYVYIWYMLINLIMSSVFHFTMFDIFDICLWHYLFCGWCVCVCWCFCLDGFIFLITCCCSYPENTQQKPGSRSWLADTTHGRLPELGKTPPHWTCGGKAILMPQSSMMRRSSALSMHSGRTKAEDSHGQSWTVPRCNFGYFGQSSWCHQMINAIPLVCRFCRASPSQCWICG